MDAILEKARKLCMKEDAESAKEFIELLQGSTSGISKSDPGEWDKFFAMMVVRITLNPTDSEFNRYLYDYIYQKKNV